MKYFTFEDSVFGQNSYLVCGQSEAFVVDAGGKFKEITAKAAKLNVKISAVLLTHGHIDHIFQAEKYKNAGIRIGIHREEERFLSDANCNLSDFFEMKVNNISADFTFDEGDEFAFGEMRVKVMHTPGHTVGSCCFLCDNVCFSGDTLFCGGIGRTDFPTGDQEQIMRSLKRIATLPPDTVVCPGHSEPSTIGDELKFNPYIR